jgi:hypothetical protein
MTGVCKPSLKWGGVVLYFVTKVLGGGVQAHSRRDLSPFSKVRSR